jgi:SAM-dependent methyltransferase
MLEHRTEYLRMAACEDRHWWYRSLHALTLDRLRARLSSPDALIVDAGCGTGGLLRRLRSCGYSNLLGFDLSEDALHLCRERGIDALHGNILDVDRICGPGSAAAIVSHDTLCYLDVEQRMEATAALGRALKPGGVLLCNLPALSAFRGAHDVSVGLLCRFSRSDLPRLFKPPLHVVRTVCWPFLLAPIVLTVRTIQRLRLQRSSAAAVRSDLDLPPALLNEYLAAVSLLDNRLLPCKPFGSSLFVEVVKTL